MQAPQIIRRAERYASGRIKGASPPILVPRVLRMLTPFEQARMLAIQAKREAVQREAMAFLASIGLNPMGQYVFHKSGAVTERGGWKPVY